MATFSRFVSAGKMKRSAKYITNGKLITVPPQSAMDMIWLKPPVMLRLTISMRPALTRASAGALSHRREAAGNNAADRPRETGMHQTGAERDDMFEKRTRRVVVLVGILQERTHLHACLPLPFFCCFPPAFVVTVILIA